MSDCSRAQLLLLRHSRYNPPNKRQQLASADTHTLTRASTEAQAHAFKCMRVRTCMQPHCTRAPWGPLAAIRPPLGAKRRRRAADQSTHQVRLEGPPPLLDHLVVRVRDRVGAHRPLTREQNRNCPCAQRSRRRQGMARLARNEAGRFAVSFLRRSLAEGHFRRERREVLKRRLHGDRCYTRVAGREGC